MKRAVNFSTNSAEAKQNSTLKDFFCVLVESGGLEPPNVRIKNECLAIWL